jgi:hypothetical protein
MCKSNSKQTSYVSRELRACPEPDPGLNIFFLGSDPGPKNFYVGPGSAFNFKQIQFDFSLKSKYSGAKVNV